jgi:hypothetical protein
MGAAVAIGEVLSALRSEDDFPRDLGLGALSGNVWVKGLRHAFAMVPLAMQRLGVAPGARFLPT